MKRISMLLLLLMTAWTTFWAQNAASAEEKSGTTTEATKSLLWEISGNGLEQPSYLFGTIHMIGKDDYIFTHKMEEAFAKTKRVTFEIKIDDMMNLSSQMSLMMKAFMSDNKTLSDLLSEEDYTLVHEHLKKQFEAQGLPTMFLGMMERMKPMFLSALTGADASPADMQSGEVVSYEFELMEKAQAAEMEILGLETAEFQMSMFDSIPYEAQAQMLLESIKSSTTGDDEFQKMVEIYKNQDIEAMQALMDSDTEGLGKYEELLLVKRNQNWIPIMGKQMQEQATFFAVGAGHLGGEYGVIKLLREAGYTVKPIK